MAEKKFIGARSPSKEGPRHVTGRGLYTDDFTLPGMLQAMIVRSPHAHAKINAVDPSEALKNPNVMAVITPADVKQLTKPFKPGRYAAGLKRPIDEYAGAIEKVRYVGEPIGAVAARDRGTAEDALELIQVDYEPLRAVVDVREAIKPSSATLFDELGTNLAWTGSLQYGDIDAAFKSADRVVKENLKIHRYSSTPLEPFVVIASYDAASKRLTVWVTAQVPEVIYDGLREALGLQDIRVIIPDVGGGFGQKIHLIRKYVVLVSLLAMKSGRPVKWIEDRSEHMMAGGHACAQEFECEAAVRTTAGARPALQRIRRRRRLDQHLDDPLHQQAQQSFEYLPHAGYPYDRQCGGDQQMSGHPQPRHRQARHVLHLGAHDGPGRSGVEAERYRGAAQKSHSAK